jgi:hypothetical protein
MARSVDPYSDDIASGRFQAPWRAEKMPGGFFVRDANGPGLGLCLQPGD